LRLQTSSSYVSPVAEDAAAMGRTDVGHYPIQKAAVDGAVIDDPAQLMVPKIGVESAVKRPVGVDVLAELRAQELPCQCVQLHTAPVGDRLHGGSLDLAGDASNGHCGPRLRNRDQGHRNAGTKTCVLSFSATTAATTCDTASATAGVSVYWQYAPLR